MNSQLPNHKNKNDLTAAVIIPSKDRPEWIDRTLANLSEQTWPGSHLEIIVIDDGSTPAYELSAPNLKIIRHDQPHGAQASRNSALATTNADLILMLDDDIELTHPDFLSAAADILLTKPEVGLVFGQKIDVWHRNGYSDVIPSDTARPTFYSGDLVPCSAGEGYVSWGCSICVVWRCLLEQLGGYDEIFGLKVGHSFREESDMHARLRRAGYKMWYAPALTFNHHITPSGGHGPNVAKRLYWIAHNHIIFLRRHLRFWPMRALGFLFDIARYSWAQGRGRYLFKMLRGYLAGWRNALRDRGPGRNSWLGS